MRRRIRISEELRQEKEQFCTECGEKLENFCFSDEVTDIDALRIRHENCKKKNKFKGDSCSRLFIARPVDPSPPDE
jgi:hypothetical protein